MQQEGWLGQGGGGRRGEREKSTVPGSLWEWLCVKLLQTRGCVPECGRGQGIARGVRTLTWSQRVMNWGAPASQMLRRGEEAPVIHPQGLFCEHLWTQWLLTAPTWEMETPLCCADWVPADDTCGNGATAGGRQPWYPRITPYIQTLL